MKELDLKFPQCPIRNVLGQFSDKWSLLILINLHVQGKIRYKTLRESIPDISHKMLSHTLKKLESGNLISREMFPEIPPRVEYSLTDMGSTLMPIIQMLIDWANQNFEEAMK
jgi:DNA-binding HxlR family transcriptional regulator